MSTEAQIPRQYIRNFPFPCSDHFKKENIESALNFTLRDDDVIISTYPKAGTTWIQYIVFEILNNGIPPPPMSEMREIMPFMEITGAPKAESLNSPRILKYHVPYDIIPKNPKSKYISVIRNPFDLSVSYFYFLKQMTDVLLEFNDFFDAFVGGKCIYGDYFDHILSWYEHRNDENVLILSYEKMRQNPRKEVLSVASFLGFDLNSNEELVEKILKHTSFEYMKKNAQTVKHGNAGSSDYRLDTIDFFRKGSIGDAKIYMNEAQLNALNERMMEKLKDTDVMRMWKDVVLS